MSQPLLVLEDIATVRRIRIGRFWGIPVSLTPLTWLGPFVWFGVGFVLDLSVPNLTLASHVSRSLMFMVAVEVATVVHGFGHILSGKLVHAAMDELVFTATRGVNLYWGDQHHYPRRVHIGRSLGGPIANLLVAVLYAALLSLLPPGTARDVVARLVSVNQFFGFGSFLPIPTVDGWVIWRALLRT